MENLKELVSSYRAYSCQTEGFDWDKWNIEKNLVKHKVTSRECEEVFLNKPYLKLIPLTERNQEQRYYAFGLTDQNRKITIVFIIRKDKIRVVSARSMSRKERRIYDKELKKITKI